MDINRLIVFTSITIGIGFAYRNGYIDNKLIARCKSTWNKLYMAFKILNGLEINPIKSDFTPGNNEISANISYNYLGHNYNINIPYDSTKIIKMGQLDAFLNLEDDTVIKITQQPGVPYLVNAQMMNGKSILIINHDNDEQYEYDRFISPMFCKEVF